MLGIAGTSVVTRPSSSSTRLISWGPLLACDRPGAWPYPLALGRSYRLLPSLPVTRESTCTPVHTRGDTFTRREKCGRWPTKRGPTRDLGDGGLVTCSGFPERAARLGFLSQSQTIPAAGKIAADLGGPFRSCGPRFADLHSTSPANSYDPQRSQDPRLAHRSAVAGC